MAFPEGLASRQGDLSKGVPLYHCHHISDNVTVSLDYVSLNHILKLTRTIIDESLIQSAKIEATTTAITITTTTITTYDHSIHTYITSLSVSTTTATTYDHSIHTYITSL